MSETGEKIRQVYVICGFFGNIRLFSGLTAGNETEVILRETRTPAAMEEMESGDWDLTLFTCTIGGACRVTVRCQQVET